MIAPTEDPSIKLELLRLKGSSDLSVPPFPQPPDLSARKLSVKDRLRLIQKYISSLEYNYTGDSFFVKRKDRGFRHVTSTAKLIVREALPIQCVEAVFLGAYLTADMKDVDRYPVCFKSTMEGRVFRHIVLAVRSEGRWGALGLSRREELMYKDLRHMLFSDLLADFRRSYSNCWHQLEQVCVGFPFPHDVCSNLPVKWKVMLSPVGGGEAEWAAAATDLDSYISCAPALFERFSWSGSIPDHPLLRTREGVNRVELAPPSVPPDCKKAMATTAVVGVTTATTATFSTSNDNISSDNSNMLVTQTTTHGSALSRPSVSGAAKPRSGRGTSPGATRGCMFQAQGAPRLRRTSVGIASGREGAEQAAEGMGVAVGSPPVTTARILGGSRSSRRGVKGEKEEVLGAGARGSCAGEGWGRASTATEDAVRLRSGGGAHRRPLGRKWRKSATSGGRRRRSSNG